MSFAPARLLELRDYLRAKTGLPLVSLGIVGSAGHKVTGTSYHLGEDDLKLHLNPYSARTSRDRAGLSNAASATDTGNFRRLVALTMWAVAQARAGRRPDTREIIGPWSDGRAYRFDHLTGWKAQLRSRGDSHESHMHESWYRDSEGRDKVRFYRPFFEGTSGDDETSVPVPSGSPLLRSGSTGTAVRQLQVALNEAANAGLGVDGDFGPATEAAVRAFQRRAGLDDDGIYGPATAGALREELSDVSAKEVWDYGIPPGADIDEYSDDTSWRALSILRSTQTWAYRATKESRKARAENAAILDAVGGLDTAAILARIDQRATEDAARDAALSELVDGALSGERDAAEVLALIAQILSQAAAEGEPATP